MTYTLTSSSNIIRDSDGANIPTDSLNKDYAEYLLWQAEGNVPNPAVIRLPTLLDYGRALAMHVDAIAQSKGYTDAAKCMAYSLSTNPVWAAEGAAFIVWQDQVFIKAFAALKLWETEGTAQTIDALIASLPKIVW